MPPSKISMRRYAWQSNRLVHWTHFSWSGSIICWLYPLNWVLQLCRNWCTREQTARPLCLLIDIQVRQCCLSFCAPSPCQLSLFLQRFANPARRVPLVQTEFCQPGHQAHAKPFGKIGAWVRWYDPPRMTWLPYNNRLCSAWHICHTLHLCNFQWAVQLRHVQACLLALAWLLDIRRSVQNGSLYPDDQNACHQWPIQSSYWTKSASTWSQRDSWRNVTLNVPLVRRVLRRR